MRKILMRLENCYGIPFLNYEFNFAAKSAYVLYAQNGLMKTSFTKTLKDVSAGKMPQERIHHNVPRYQIIVTEENQTHRNLESEEIFVIESYNESFTSEHMSTLLVNPRAKQEYDRLVSGILRLKSGFLERLNQEVGASVNVEKEIQTTFHNENILEVFTNLIDNNDERGSDYGLPWNDGEKYQKVFNEKVGAFLDNRDNIELLRQYKESYEELIANSRFLRQGVFSAYNAKEIGASLNQNGFFEAGHKIKFSTGQEVESQLSLQELVNAEKAEVLTNPRLRTAYNKIERLLNANNQLRDFTKLIESCPELIPEIVEYHEFKCNVWRSILYARIDEMRELVLSYRESKQRIEEIQRGANREADEWRRIVEIFEKRFQPPFKVTVENQRDVVLKNSVPVLAFTYAKRGENVPVTRGLLNEVLSGGEKRSLYLLNIIFELEALKRSGREVLIIADDIAESFDYRNKYAILEYLFEQYEADYAKMIILTHNFDFYRTLGSRMLGSKRDYCLMATEREGRIELQKGQYLKNVFGSWKGQLENKAEVFLASIPFVRNLAEYRNSTECEEYKQLTKMLHFTVYGDGIHTEEITKGNIADIFEMVWGAQITMTDETRNSPIYPVLIECADNILREPDRGIVNLEKRIVLSMAIRLKAEKYMILALSDTQENQDEVQRIQCHRNSTGVLIKFYKTCFPHDLQGIKTLLEVGLLTPENIHLNSFMYEPLIDVSLQQLKDLYSAVARLEGRNLEVMRQVQVEGVEEREAIAAMAPVETAPHPHTPDLFV